MLFIEENAEYMIILIISEGRLAIKTLKNPTIRVLPKLNE